MRRLAWPSLLALAFAIPWEYSLDFGPPYGNVARLIGLITGILTILAILQTRSIRSFDAVHWLVLALFLWSGLTYFWSIDPASTLFHLRGYGQEMSILWMVWELADSNQDLRNLLRAFLAGSFVLAVLTAYALAVVESPDQVRFFPPGQDPNDVARFLVLAVPAAALLVVSESNRLLQFIAACYLPVAGAAVLLTASRGGALAGTIAAAGAVAILSRGSRRRGLAVTGGALVALVAIWAALPWATIGRLLTIPDQLASGDLNQRLQIWSAGMLAYVEHPLIGTGLASFVQASGLAQEDTAHSTPLALAVEGGLPALGLALGIVVLNFRSTLKLAGPLRLALLTTLAVWAVGATVATVQENRTTWLMFAIVAVAYRLRAEPFLQPSHSDTADKAPADPSIALPEAAQ